jgi:hypothetical protein
MSLLCWSKCKQYALDIAKGRAHKFTRVSRDVETHLECIVRREIGRLVHAMPSKGVTIAMGTHKRNKKEDSNNDHHICSVQ